MAYLLTDESTTRIIPSLFPHKTKWIFAEMVDESTPLFPSLSKAGTMIIATPSSWYDWLMILNPMYLPRRLSVLKFRLHITAELYILVPLLKLYNSIKGSLLPTPVVPWDYDPENHVDDAIIEPNIKQLSKRLQADFYTNKYGAYLRRSLGFMSRVMPSYIRGITAMPHNESSLYNYIATTSLSFSCAPDGQTLDLTIFNRVPESPDRKNPVLPGYTFKLDHTNRKAYVFEGEDSVPPSTPNVTTVVSTALLAYTHSFIHFHLPTSMALFADKLMHDPVKQGSRLAKLLDTHTRFTLVFNFAGHNMFFPVQKQDSSFPHCFSITQHDFAFLNIARTQHYYYLTGENQGGSFVTPSCQYKDMYDFDDRFVFHRVVKMYYPYIDKFVREYGVESDLLEEFVAFLKVAVPSIEIKDPMTMLVTLIWQVSVFHSLDHFAIFQQREYMAFGNPKDPWNVAASRYTLETYVDPFASPNKGEYLHHHLDIVGLPNWDRIVSSISF